MAPTNIQTLYAPLGGQCATGNLSDPEATYDKAAGRWLITMIAFNNSMSVNNLCVAVSTSSDATGTFHLYSFAFGANLPDYPKLGVWPDAYYVTTNSFPNGGAFTGAETCALDRTKMLAGSTATMICFQRGISDASLLPADLDGATPPPVGSQNYQMELASSTTLNLFKFHVNFALPSHSTFSGPTVLTVPAYTDACAATGTCGSEPSLGEQLDSLGDRLMYRLAYRNLGDTKPWWQITLLKQREPAMRPPRCVGMKSGNPGTVPVVFQQGTVGGGSNTIAFWMGSIAMDKNGDIALGFSASSSTLNPSIAYVGRIPTDPAGSMESPNVIIIGTGVQAANSFNRWATIAAWP